ISRDAAGTGPRLLHGASGADFRDEVEVLAVGVEEQIYRNVVVNLHFIASAAKKIYGDVVIALGEVQSKCTAHFHDAFVQIGGTWPHIGGGNLVLDNVGEGIGPVVRLRQTQSYEAQRG